MFRFTKQYRMILQKSVVENNYEIFIHSLKTAVFYIITLLCRVLIYANKKIYNTYISIYNTYI